MNRAMKIAAKIGLVVSFIGVMLAGLQVGSAAPPGGGGGGACYYCNYHTWAGTYTCDLGGGGSGCHIYIKHYWPNVTLGCDVKLGPCGPAVGGIAP
jgi:hypothetical protein